VNENNATFKKERLASGMLMTLSRIFKHGKREEVIPYSDGLVTFIVSIHNDFPTIINSKCVFDYYPYINVLLPSFSLSFFKKKNSQLFEI
jgi:hypothetical protein